MSRTLGWDRSENDQYKSIPVSEDDQKHITIPASEDTNGSTMNELRQLQKQINKQIIEVKSAEDVTEKRRQRLAQTLNEAQKLLDKLDRRMSREEKRESENSSEVQQPQGTLASIREQDRNDDCEIIDECSASQVTTNQDLQNKSQNFAADGEISQFSQQIIEGWQWLLKVRPLKSPYMPQIDDEIVYFRQGHEEYLNSVEKNGLYEIDDSKDRPWTYMGKINTQEFVRVKSISFDYPLLGLCELELERLEGFKDSSNKDSFKIRYRDVNEVVDFLILRQMYDESSKRVWKASNKFRCAIGDEWMFGTIINVNSPYQGQHPMSPFKSILVEWCGQYIGTMDNRVSHWELEPVEETTLPKNKEDKVFIQPEEEIIIYKPKSTEWPSEGREFTCQKILNILEQLKQERDQFYGEPIFELGRDQSYLEETAYPIDLSIIEARLKHNYYRRFSALKFDVDCLKENIASIKRGFVKLRNTKKKNIDELPTLSALICRVLKEIDEGTNEIDIIDLHYEIANNLPITQDLANTQSTYQPESESVGSSQEFDLEEEVVNKNKPQQKWLEACKSLIQDLLDNEDSEPFRVETSDHSIPSLFNIKENLEINFYKNPREVKKDLDLIFKNKKNNKIYQQIERMKAIYEEPIEEIIEAWVSERRTSSSKKSPTKRKVDISDDLETGEINLISKKQKQNDEEAGPSGIKRDHARRFSLQLNKGGSSTSAINENDDDDGVRVLGSRKSNSPKKNHILDDDDDSDDEKKQPVENTDGNEENESNYLSDEEFEQKKPSRTPKKNTPEKKKPAVEPFKKEFTSIDYIIASIAMNSRVKSIVGRVCKHHFVEEVLSEKKEDCTLFDFKVECAEGDLVHVKAWNRLAMHYVDLIKNNQIIKITNLNAIVPKKNYEEYHECYDKKCFQLVIQERSEISLISRKTGNERKLPKH